MAHIDLTCRFWPNGVIPYRISENAKALGWEPVILDAIQHWQNRTNVRFVNHVFFKHPNWVSFDINPIQSVACSSDIGMQGGQQTIRCNATTMPNAGVIIHEIGHLVGLKHEHQRIDRDDHVLVNLSQVDADGRWGDYERLSPPFFWPMGSYDCNSAMHYTGPNNSIVARSGGNCGPSFGAGALSAGDIAAVDWMYPTAATPGPDANQAGVMLDPLKVPSVSAIQWWRPPRAGARPMPRKDVFARGLDRQIYQSWRESDEWQPWTTAPGAGGTFRSGPTSVSWATDRLALFAIGDDFRVYQTSWTGQTWSGWGALLGNDEFYWAPAVISRKKNRIDLFAIDKEFKMHHRIWNGGAWSTGQQKLPAGQFLFQPSAVSWGENRIDLFAVGMDLRLYQATWLDGSGWQGWASHFGDRTFVSAPVAVTRQVNSFDIFARSNDAQIYHSSWNGVKWSAWSLDLGQGLFTSGPGAVNVGANRIDVYAVGGDRRMRRTLWKAGSGWSGWMADMGEGEFA